MSYDVRVSDTGERISVPVKRTVSLSDKKGVSRCVEDASLILTAVGPDNLVHVADVIAEPLIWASKKGRHLNVLACENMVANSSTLKKLVESKVTPEEAKILDESVGFPDCVVDRIAVRRSTQIRDVNPAVSVEAHFEWIVDSTSWKGKERLGSLTFVENLEPFVKRKLYVLNGAHATIGFVGQQKGIRFVHEVMEDPEFEKTVRSQMLEAAAGLCGEYGLEFAEQEKYAESALRRFKNPRIGDETLRLTRSKIRKLGAKERLVGPALLALKHGIEPISTARGIASLLLYCTKQSDEESNEISSCLNGLGVGGTLAKFSGLDLQERNHARLAELVSREYAAVKVTRK